jgi:signal transduction histidine kinase
MLLLAIGGGAVLGQRAQVQINSLGRTLTAISRGDLAARVPVTGTGGDLDVVSRQINDTLTQLQSLFENVNQSSADIAHDLKTPIGRLRQRLEALRDSAGTMADNRASIDNALTEIDKIVSTFDGLLNITQIEAGVSRDRFRPVEINGLVESIVEAYEVVAEDAGMTLVLNETATRSPLLIDGDRDLIGQLLANLVENAIRHCPKATKITLSTAADPAGGCLLTVADTGLGIPESEHDRVFRRLYRLEKSRTSTGSGLGLALVKAIADLHKAKISLADNRPGLKVEVHFPPAEQLSAVLAPAR